jgi:hypothetical protein
VRRELIVGGAVAAVLIALIAWVATHTYWAQITINTPLRGDAARNPHYTLEHMVQRLGIRSREIPSLREPPTDSVVLIDQLEDDFTHQRTKSLESWVEAGGRLVITGEALRADGALQSWSGVRLAHRDPDRSASPLGLEDSGCTPMAVRVNGETTGQSLNVCTPTAEFYWASDHVPAWSLSDAQGAQVVSVDIGDGEFTVIGPTEILSNTRLLAGDHAELLIESAGLRRQDTLQVLNPPEPQSLPQLLWRLAGPAILFFAAALILVVTRCLPRFGPPLPAPAAARRSLAEQIRANARFTWRTHKPQMLRAAVLRSLEETAGRHICLYRTLGVQRRAEQLAASTGIDSGAIAAALNEDSAINLNEYRAAMTLLELCRRILLKSDSRTATAREPRGLSMNHPHER